MEFQEIISLLEKNANVENQKGMERFAITAEKVYGTGVPFVRSLAKTIKKMKNEKEKNELAKKLWKHGAHETKLLATMVASPSIGWDVVEKWIDECQNWAEVDQLCMNLLGNMEGASEKALEYSKEKEQWRKRTGFSLMAVITWREKKKIDPKTADRFLEAIERESADERNFVKKAVNWALRHIGKMGSKKNYEKALVLSKKLMDSKNKTARWIGSDAYRELKKKGPPG